MNISNIEHLLDFIITSILPLQTQARIYCKQSLKYIANILTKLQIEFQEQQNCILVNPTLQQAGVEFNIIILCFNTSAQTIVSILPDKKYLVDLEQYFKQPEDYALFAFSEASDEKITNNMEFIMEKSRLIKQLNQGDKAQFNEFLAEFKQTFYCPSQSNKYKVLINKLFNGNRELPSSLACQQFVACPPQVLVDNFGEFSKIAKIIQSISNEQLSVELNNLINAKQLKRAIESVFNFIIFQDKQLCQYISLLFPSLLLPHFYKSLSSLKEPVQKLPRELQLSTFQFAVQQFVPENFVTEYLMGKMQSMCLNKVLWAKICTYLLFNYQPAQIHQLAQILRICVENINADYVSFFLQNNKALVYELYQFDTVLRPHPELLFFTEQKVPVSFQDSFQAVFETFVIDDFKNLLKDYKKLIKSINEDKNLNKLVNDDNYEIITSSSQFVNIMNVFHQFFTQNVLSFELAELLKNENNLTTERFRKQLSPKFTVQETTHCSGLAHQLVVLKNNISLNIFVKVCALLIAEFYETDHEDKLLQGINKLRNEEMAIIQEQNLDQNELVNKSIVTDKLSLFMQQLICQLIENNNFSTVCQYIQQNYKANAEQILSNLHLRLQNAHQLLPKLEKHVLQIYNKSGQKERIDSLLLGLPLYIFANDQYNIANKPLQNKLQQYHVGFLCFLMDICPKAKIHEDALISDADIEMLQKTKRNDKHIIDNVKQSIKSNIYTVEQMGYFLGTIVANSDINVAPNYINIDTKKDLNFKSLYDDLSSLISKNKRQILKFLLNPSSMSTYSVKEQLMGKSIQPLIDVFSQSHTQVKDILCGLALHLLLLDESSMFFEMVLDYQQMKDFQVAGISSSIGGAYHYDCLIKDTVTGNTITFSVRKLTVAQFRFFILLYCGIILISSLVFNNYKSHSEYCGIISPYGTLMQDRYTYLISQISNSLNVISNVKGFSERGAVGYCNTVLFSFLCANYSKSNKVEPEQLEADIALVDHDLLLSEYCRVFTLMQETKPELEPVGTQTVATQDNITKIDLSSDMLNLSTKISQKLSASEKLKRQYVRQQKMLQELNTGIKYLYRAPVKETLTVGSQLVKFAQKDPQMADFIRIYGRSLNSLSHLIRLTINLKNLIFQMYDNQLYSYEIIQTTLEPALIKEFVETYNITRHELLSIQNMCNEQEFPEITDQISIGQLVFIGQDSRDGQSRLSLLDEIIISFVKIVNKIKVENAPKQEIEVAINNLCYHFSPGFANQLENDLDIEGLASYIRQHLCYSHELYYEPKSLQTKMCSIEAAETYQQFLTKNALFLEANPDFKSNEDEFDSFFILDRENIKKQIQEVMEGDNSVVEQIAKGQMGQFYEGTIDQVMTGVYALDVINGCGEACFKSIIALWSAIKE
ncbi:Conserved_hypothetical protein [Hexamita inflata]|uniref:Uncharacterized protein n=1 Tax=Hexamita inflata TaxID=28002 RepID=A0AA86NZ27_9EUKA|nr:Conserved hypothetical protein [Hexamita inflata]